MWGVEFAGGLFLESLCLPVVQFEVEGGEVLEILFVLEILLVLELKWQLVRWSAVRPDVACYVLTHIAYLVADL